MTSTALQLLAGLPLADFAFQVWSDLNRVGIPVHLVGASQRACGPDGIDLNVTEDCLILTWNVPDERIYGASGDEGAGLSHSVGILTAAVAAVLASRGHCVRSEAPDPPWAPPLFVYPPAPGSVVRTQVGQRLSSP
ncbi:hypothetical protein AB0L75_24845 [Streptomyces sp. NPDC052101]|uniref:hypothetical protein n=1 Tax=Streptomyces sp. NPDC052101 TaxID=3155763 RepID=UPI003443DD8F